MYTILNNLANYLMLLGGVLFVLGGLFWLWQGWHKKAHGPVPKNVTTGMTIGMFVTAFVVATPISMVVFRDAKSGGQDRSESAFDRVPTVNQQNFGAHNALSENTRRQIDLTVQRQQIAENEQRAALGLQPLYRTPGGPITDSQRARAKRQRDRSEKQSAYRTAVRELWDDQSAHILRMVRYDPLPVDEPARQEPLDQQINEAIDVLLQLKADKKQAEQELVAITEQQRDLYAQRPVDRTKTSELGTQISELQTAIQHMATPIWKQEQAINALVKKRVEAGSYVNPEPLTEVPEGDPRDLNEIRLDEKLEENAHRLVRQREVLDALIERQMPEYEAKQAELKREREAQKAEIEQARQERQRRAYEAQKAEREFQTNALKAMRDAKVYQPPYDTSTTEVQRELDEQIIAGNNELQALIAEKERLDQVKEEANTAYREAMQRRPYNKRRVDRARERMEETRGLGRELPGEIMRKRSDLEQLVRQRFAAEAQTEG